MTQGYLGVARHRVTVPVWYKGAWGDQRQGRSTSVTLGCQGVVRDTVTAQGCLELLESRVQLIFSICFVVRLQSGHHLTDTGWHEDCPYTFVCYSVS